jgi:hypothetical protein
MRFIGNDLERVKRWMSAGLTGRLTDVKVCASLRVTRLGSPRP